MLECEKEEKKRLLEKMQGSENAQVPHNGVYRIVNDPIL